VLWHAAASGVGTAAVQLCRHLGFHCVGTSRSAAKLERLRVLGLEEAIDTGARGFREQLAEPVHAVVDSLGGPALADNLAVLHSRGRLVVLGLLLGARSEIDLGLVLRKRVEIIGTAMRSRSFAERVPLLTEFAARMLPAFSPAPGRTPLVPVIDAVLPMTELAHAHALMERNETFGKLLLRW
jgi:NADPH:quinone reductase-like Zn-dependent oxidoreductase